VSKGDREQVRRAGPRRVRQPLDFLYRPNGKILRIDTEVKPATAGDDMVAKLAGA
jgi:hypothetical protein